MPQGKKKEIRPLSPDEARVLLDAARGDRLEALYVLAISTGLREGELLALLISAQTPKARILAALCNQG